VLKPGSGSYAVTYDVVTEDEDDNAHCGSDLRSGSTKTRVADAIINGTLGSGYDGFMKIGDMVDSVNGLDLSPLPANNDFAVTIYHEMAHSLGVLSRVPALANDAMRVVMSQVSDWDTHLLDRNHHGLAQGTTISVDPADASSSDVFFVGENNQSGVRFTGPNVAHVLSDGTKSLAEYDTLPSQDKYAYGLPIEGVEKFGTPKAAIDLSHFELERSLMSHQSYRNHSVFMEAELAALQDIGYDIDRNLFYGESIYTDGNAENDRRSVTVNTAHTDVSGTLGVGLHVYGKYNAVTLNANLTADGEAGTGVRMDGSGSSLTVKSYDYDSAVFVSAGGKNGTGLLVAYGKSHVVDIASGATVAAAGTGGIGARFDFGHNLCGDHDEYRGSYIRWKKEDGEKENLSILGNDNDGLALNLDGPLVQTFTVKGTLTGDKAAVFISENALVQTINIETGATVTGDIISEWDAQNEDIQYSGSRDDLLTTLNLTGALNGNIDGLDGIRLVNAAAHTLQSVKVNSLADTGGLTVGDGANPATLIVAGDTSVDDGKTLTLQAEAEAEFRGGLDLNKNNSGGTLAINNADAVVGAGKAVVYGAGSRITVTNGGSLEADAASFLTLNANNTTVTLEANAGTVFTGSDNSGKIRLRLADAAAGYYLAQLDNASSQMNLTGPLAFIGRLNLTDSQTLAMRPGDAAPTVYASGSAQRTVEDVRYNAVRLENAGGALMAPGHMTVSNSAFRLSHWTVADSATDAALTVSGTSDVAITGLDGEGAGIFRTEDGAAVPTGLAVADSATVTLGSEDEDADMPLRSVSVSGTATLNLSHVATSPDTLAVAGGTVNSVGSDVAAGALAMDGGKLFVEQSRFSAGTVANGTLGGAVLASDGAGVSLGSGSLASPNEVAEGQAVLALGAPISLGSAGALYVDPTASFDGNAIASDHNAGQVADITSSTQRAYFAPDSLLVLDAAALGGKAAITASGAHDTAVVDNDARLQILNATVNGATILQGFHRLSLYGWEDVTTPDRMLSLKTELADGDTSIMLSAEVNDPQQAMPGLGDGSAGIMRSLWRRGGNDVNSRHGGVAFLSRAAREDYIADARDAARTIESAAHIALVGGVPHMTFQANNAAAGAAASRTGLGRQPSSLQAVAADGSAQTGLSAGDGYGTTGFAMWITPLFQSWQGRDLTSDELKLDVNGRLGGVALGADYTFENAIRAGIAFNIGGGYAEGSGQFADTRNNFNFWGLGAYAGWAYRAFALTADVNYTASFHNLRQELPATLGMGGQLKTDASSYAISAGLRAECTHHGRTLDVTPHAAVRHTYLHVNSYEAEANGRTILEGDAVRQSIWSFPVGLTFSRDVALDNGWHVRPLVDFLVIPHAGDVKARADVRFTGVDAKGEMQAQMLDYVTWGCRLGLEAGNEQVKLGLDYNLQVGANSVSHGVFGTLRYEF